MYVHLISRHVASPVFNYPSLSLSISQYNFVTNMNDQSACCVLLNVCDLEQELWSKGKIYEKLILTKRVFLMIKNDV